MRSNINQHSTRLVFSLALIMLAGLMVACSLSIAFDLGDDDETHQAMATPNAFLATRIARYEDIISYLATIIPQPSRVGRPPIFTPTPYLPVQGAVIIEEGRSAVGGIAGDTIQIAIAFRASSPMAEVTHMRVLVGSGWLDEREMAYASWEPFVMQRSYPVHLALNWVGFYVSVQYRDAQGNLSPIYRDDISVEGMPPTPTP
jgi:hypothetical protein